MNSKRGDNISQDAKRTAWEELLIAEGSDWCWWYGPEHSSANKPEFDQLFRDHLSNVYERLGEPVPSTLNKPFIRLQEPAFHQPPGGLIQPTIDGRLSSHVEWANAGRYRIDPRSGNMHSLRSLVQDLYYGSDGQSMYFRVDLGEPFPVNSQLEFRLVLRNTNGDRFEVNVKGNSSGACSTASDLPSGAVTACLGDIYEARISMSALGVRLGEPVFLQMCVLRDGLPVAAIPATGELQLQSGSMVAYAW